MLYALELSKDRNLENVKDTVIKHKKIEFKARSTGKIIPENIEKYVAAKKI